ncbi:hypothetical protein BJY00DRAFT_284618 [Aspergillus carlsbadensis]|nr:hypothetical protein BJY00DRAFT_284618 [Aspergillus carlsbadensis]
MKIWRRMPWRERLGKEDGWLRSCSCSFAPSCATAPGGLPQFLIRISCGMGCVRSRMIGERSRILSLVQYAIGVALSPVRLKATHSPCLSRRVRKSLLRLGIQLSPWSPDPST